MIHFVETLLATSLLAAYRTTAPGQLSAEMKHGFQSSSAYCRSDTSMPAALRLLLESDAVDRG